MEDKDTAIGDMASDGEAPTVTIEIEEDDYRSLTTRIEVPVYEVEDLLQQAIRGTLKEVNGDTLLTELRARQ